MQYQPDGTIAFLNRIDFQVKIRGFRIELGEIESVLSQVKGIRENVVVVREDKTGEKMLVAYYIADGKIEIAHKELRQYLKERLPDYMIPAAFVQIEKFPLTSTLKVDRQTLSAASLPEVEEDENFVAPATEREIRLATIWKDILKIDKVGIHSGFFELGGHSLKATQLIARIKREFNIGIPFRSIYDRLTISGLLNYIDEQSNMMPKEQKHSISRSDIGKDEFPLSSSQRRIWFMENYNPGMTAYNIPLDYRIMGDLNIEVLKKSLDYLIQRHKSFRTIFPNVNGVPVQKILPAWSSNLSIIRLEGEPKEKIPMLIQKYSLENASYKFNLETGPLYRFQLLITGEEEFIFLINIHHIISDATSLCIFADEIKQVYDSLINDKTINLPIIPVTYTDFTLFENQWQNGEEYRNQLEFWKKELSGVPEVIQLPMDFHRPKKTTYQGTEYHLSIDLELKNKLIALSKKTGTGLSMPLLSAFAILLNRYSSQDDFVLGFPVANRTCTELESLTGVFINTLPIRFTFPEDITFSDVVGNTKKIFLSAYENQEIPIDRLVEELKVRRTMNINPLFQVLFNYLTCFPNEIKLPGATLQMLVGERITARFDLTLTVNDKKNDLDCAFEYNTDLFSRETIARMSGHYLTILRAIAENADLNIKSIPMLTEKEKNLILGEWNNTCVDYPSEKCIHHLFEKQVLKTPDSIAVAFENKELTYAELNAKANQLARYLVKQGAKEGTIVAMCLHRSIDMVIALLAISKSGATYLPLDPIYPKARLGLILDDAKPIILVSELSMAANLPETEARIMFLDEKEEYSVEFSENLPFGNAQNHAYIRYTSGSTGKPKGVQIRHHSVVNLVCSMSKLLKVTSQDILLAVTTISFDISELEIFLPLFAGAKLVIASENTAMNVELLKNKIDESDATLFQATPVTFKMLVLEGWKGKQDLKLICGGEAFSKELARELLPRCKEVWNAYGPTETTIWSVVKKLNPEDCAGEGYVPIGRPVDNTKLFVLNKKLVPVPVGIAGELCIGGEGISTGYYNLTKMTEEQFIPDPFSRDPESRIPAKRVRYKQPSVIFVRL